MANLNELVDEHLAAAKADERGRSAELIVHDGELRQSIIALTEGAMLPTHNSPPAASIQVLTGSIRVEHEAGLEPQGEFHAGELWTLTHERHSVLALEDTAFLLTTVTGVGRDSHS